jgi:RHS repeat-associated protein
MAYRARAASTIGLGMRLLHHIGRRVTRVCLKVGVLGVIIAAALAVLPSSTLTRVAAGAPTLQPGQTATLLPDGRWLLIGGQAAQGPLAGVAILDPRTGIVISLPPLVSARAWHTATQLSDGGVLVVGGVGPAGQLVSLVEHYDPGSQTSHAMPAAGLTPRAYQTATLLTDGRVLIAGGVSQTGQVLRQAELWDPQSQAVQAVAAMPTTERRGAMATLLPDGTVLLWGGVDAAGTPLATGDVFDPVRQAFSRVTAIPSSIQPSSAPPQAEASMPAPGSGDVPLDSLVVLRFSKPLQVETVNTTTVTLSGPRGPEPVTVVAAEGGRLAFITPQALLTAGTTYTVVVNGAADTQGGLLPFTSVAFMTAQPVAARGTGQATILAAAPAPAGHSHLPAVQVAAGTPSDLDEYEWKGERRDGRPYSRWHDLPPLQAPPGVTALAGQVLQLNGQPMPNVTMRIGPRTTRTDRTGRFLLSDIGEGWQVLVMDGSTANRPARSYGIFDYGLGIVQKTTNVLPFTSWMPLLDMAHATAIPVPTPSELVATTPRIPGLEVHIPANIVLQTVAGPVTVMPLTRIPVDRPPFPLPAGATFSFTPQAHGAAVLRPDGTPSPVGIRMILPNVDGLPPGTRVELVGYDSDQHGWYAYGYGTVSQDSQQIIPDAGVEFHRMTCYFVLGPDQHLPGPIAGGVRVGEPVDAGTGLFTMEKIDLVLPDIIPIVMRRYHRPGDTVPRQLGVSNFFYQMYLVGDWTTFTYADLILADASRIHYTRISPGTGQTDAVMEHTTTPTAFYKSQLTWNTVRGGWDITLTNGTVYEFPGSGKSIGPALVGIRDRVGNRLTVNRDWVTGRMTRIISPNGRWVDVTYDPTLGNISQIRDNLGRTVTYANNGYNRIVSVTDPAGGVTQYTYASSATSQMLTLKDARGIVYLTNQYNSNNRVTLQTQADGTTFQFAYTLDQNGKVTQTDITDPRGFVRRLTFNSNGYVLSDTRALGTAIAQPTTYVRDATSNLPTSITDPLGRRTDLTYDSKGNALTVTRLAGTSDAVTTTFTYEPTFNQVASVTDPLGHTTTFTYDTLGNLTTITDPLSQTVTLTYNTAGQPITVTTPAGTTQLGYDRGDVATIIDPVGNTTTRFTDDGGRVVSLTNSLGQRSRFDYDVLNQLKKITDPLGGATQLAYDANGNLLSLTDARNNATSYSYSTMDRATGRTDPLLHQEGYGYDNNGNPTSFTDRKSQVTSRTFDGLNRLTQITYQNGSTSSFAWDAGNRLTQAVDSISGTITRTYDSLDRLTQEVTPQGTVSYTYDAAGRRTSMTVLGQSAINYTYDNADRLTQITQGTSAVSISYDNVGRRTSLALPTGVSTEYAWDAASRLTGLTYKNGSNVLGTLTYGYDAASNRTLVSGTWARTGLPLAVASATYNAANQQVTFGGQALTYDFNGDLTSDGVTTYTWDARNRLASLSGPGITTTFQYDPLGRRPSKTVNGTTTTFLYDRLNPVQEQQGGSPTANLLTGLGIDEYLTRTDSAGQRGFFNDGPGSTVGLTDSSGAVATSYTYEPFGTTSVTGASTGNSFEYTARENDGAGLRYYRARYYHPRLQRFVSEDPIEFESRDVNLYNYVGNDPLNWTDPLGLITMPAPGGVPPRGEFGAPRGRRRHQGVDLRSPLGGCIVAADDGVVIKINSEAMGGPGGNEIIINNRTGSYSVYSHTQPISGIAVGTAVKEGRPIGTTDLSGTSTGAHLHYQYKPQGESDYADPMKTQLWEAFPYPQGVTCPGRY